MTNEYDVKKINNFWRYDCPKWFCGRRYGELGYDNISRWYVVAQSKKIDDKKQGNDSTCYMSWICASGNLIGNNNGWKKD